MKLRLLRVWRYCAALILACGLLLPFPATAQNLLPPVLGTAQLPLLPYLDYYIDTSGSMTVQQIASPDMAQRFASLQPRNLPFVQGVTWLRLSIAPLPEGAIPDKALVNLGSDVPGTPVFYTPTLNPLSKAIEWQESDGRIQLLPEAGMEVQTCYVRLNGLPGFWFDPVLSTPQAATGNWGELVRTGATGALGFVLLLCLLRSITARGQWRVWTSLYVAVALAQAFLGIPETEAGRVTSENAVAVLSPGVALILLPHVGRHLMATRRFSRALDVQYLLFSLVGALLVLAPLTPQFSWLIRFLPLWPAVLLLFVPTTLAAVFMGLGGARRFLLGCLLPPLAVLGAFVGMDSGYEPALLASLPTWGIALSALLIAVTGTPRRKNDPDTSTTSIPVAPPDDDFLSFGTENVSSGVAAAQDDAGLVINLGDFAAVPAQEDPADSSAAETPRVSAREQTAEPLAAGTLNLQYIMRRVHDDFLEEAEKRNLGFSWYMPPDLGHLYAGDGTVLRHVLHTLLQASVAATTKGAIQFAARRVRDSHEEGHLLFTVHDTGLQTPQRMEGIQEAFELTMAHKGFFNVESTPQGTLVSFTLHLQPVEEKKASPASAAASATAAVPGILVVAPELALRQQITHFLEREACVVRQASSLSGALTLHAQRPAAVVIVAGPEATPAVAGLLERFHAAGQQVPLGIIAITKNETVLDRLVDAGFSHALGDPVDESLLRETVREILQQSSPHTAGAEQKKTTPAAKPIPDLFAEPAPAAARAKAKPARGPLDLTSFGVPQDTAPKNSRLSEKKQAEAMPSLVEDELDTIVATEAARARQEVAAQETGWHAPAPAEPASMPADPSPRVAESPAPAQRTAEPAPAALNVQHAEEKPEPRMMRTSSVRIQPPAARSTMTESELDDLPDFVRSEEVLPQEASEPVKLPSSKISGPWVTADGEASPALQNAWKGTGSAAPSSRRTLSDYENAARNPGFQDGVVVGEPMPVPSSRRSQEEQSVSPERKYASPEYDVAILKLIERMDAAMLDANNAFRQRRLRQTAQAAARIAEDAIQYGYRDISRLARNVERASLAGDMNVDYILRDLGNAIERMRMSKSGK